MSRAINVCKSLQLEKLQERYIPSFEEELQKLSTCLSRIESALEKHDFDAMRPEFLLRTSLQLRSRLNKLRSDVQPTRTLDGELPPIPLPGCISRSKAVHDLDDSSPSEDRDDLPQTDLARETEWDKTENLRASQPSAPATSIAENGTIVPFPESLPPSTPTNGEPPRENLHPILAGPYRGGNLAAPLANIPADSMSPGTGATVEIRATVTIAGTFTNVVSVDGDASEINLRNNKSQAITLAQEPPCISRQPQSQTVLAGQSATFSLGACGSEPLFYQWFFNGKRLIGRTNDTLTLTNVQTSQAGPYLVTVRNEVGEMESNVASLSVQ